ncbi:hypothetical protein AB9P05_14150 [Roseivirga sp. BDSF3-8]|uniref:DUF7149 domain-containing protein n=1 Tax=Roseivirga sp. BDSF3-8 TaxID=3241598 RepID=UPI0035323322
MNNSLLLKPKQALNKAFRKVKPTRDEIETFKKAAIALLDGINPAESEEHHKNLLIAFLNQTGYQGSHAINTKDRTDLAIHHGPKSSSEAGVLIEAKRPPKEGTPQAEMVRPDRLNAKALQELLLYYLRERITAHNTGLRHLVVTDIQSWYIWDVQTFEAAFAEDKKLVKQFKEFEEGRSGGRKTEYFYKEIAAPAIARAQQVALIPFAHFSLADYEKALRNESKKDDTKLGPLLKLLSPQHLLKLPFANDFNTLDRRFYTELLHIIGLEEVKDKGRKLIRRKAKPDPASLLEQAIERIDMYDKLEKVENAASYGDTRPERLFGVALELCITG